MKKPDSTQVLQILLVVVLFANCIIHFCSPAYKEYKSKSAALQEKYTAFEKHIASELLPILRLFAEFKTTNCIPVSAQISTTNFSPSVVFSQSNGIEAMPKNAVAGSVCSVGRQFYFSFEGWTYAVGDLFFGSPIVSITPTLVRTTDCFFTIQSKGGAECK